MKLLPDEINYAIGVDVGGSHITAGLVNLSKRLLIRPTLVRKKVDSHGSADEIIETWRSTIAEVLKLNALNVVPIGFAMPGPFDYENGISLMQSNMHKFETLYGMNIKSILSEKLNIPTAQIFFRNDAEAFLAGEIMSGSGRGYNKAIGVTLGTGLGTASYTNGKTIDTDLGMSLKYLDSVVEDYISTRWFVNRYFEVTGKKIVGVKDLAENISQDKIAKDIFNEFRKNLLAVLTLLIKLEKEVPDVIVAGGNISNALTHYFSVMQHELRKKFPNIVLRKAQLGENAALIGAAERSLSVSGF